MSPEADVQLSTNSPDDGVRFENGKYGTRAAGNNKIGFALMHDHVLGASAGIRKSTQNYWAQITGTHGERADCRQTSRNKYSG